MVFHIRSLASHVTIIEGFAVIGVHTVRRAGITCTGMPPRVNDWGRGRRGVTSKFD